MGKFSWSPWMGMDELNEMTRRMGRGGEANNCGERYLWNPASDMLETPCEFIVEMELPGLSLKEVAVEFHGTDLWVYGERRREKDARGNVYHSMERECGPFARRFELPHSVDAAGISAVLREGVLRITVPKRSARPRRRIVVE